MSMNKYKFVKHNPKHWSLSEFQNSCLHGHLTEVKRWVESGQITKSDVIMDDTWIVRQICLEGHLEVLKWLSTKFELTRTQVLGHLDGFDFCCRRGHLETAKWLFETFQITPDDSPDILTFWWTCRHGHLEMAQWYHQHLPITKADVVGKDAGSCLFFCVCQDEQFHVADWLLREFSITKFDLFQHQHHMFSLLEIGCEFVSQLEVLKYLVRTFQLTREEALGTDLDVLFTCCCRDLLINLEWLIEAFHINKTDMAKHNFFLRPCLSSCWCEDLKLVRWLISYFKITPKDIDWDHLYVDDNEKRHLLKLLDV